MCLCPKLVDIKDGEVSGTEDGSVSCEESEVDEGLTWCNKMSILWGRELGFTTAVVCFSCFIVNFLYYGGVYAFPQILPSLGIAISPAVNLFLGAVIGLVGTCVSLGTLRTFDRK